ncbi:immune inhibitor A domain-containing protein, partial [Aeromicrobium massiliense]|uniref:immune inhibitor A domain-containing protein n=1 Tax=Aeromicrobium massiliense TaxID=1464554 RepID=UPI001C54E5E8
MRRLTTGLIGLGLTASFGVAYGAPAQAAPAPQQPAAEKAQREHDLPNPLEDKRRALREEALSSVLSGDATTVQKDGSTVVKLGKAYAPADAAAQGNAKARTKLRAQQAAPKQVDQYVELEQERADKVFVILAEFGDERHPDFPDSDWASAEDAVQPQRFDGPLHNQIPEPDRRKDNTTIWQKDFSQQHYDDMYFADGKKDESLKTYYETQSSGRYTVDGEVSDWVKVRYNQARYGRTDEGAWDLVRDALDQWVADREAAGATP